MAAGSDTEGPQVVTKPSRDVFESELLRFSDNDSCFCSKGCQREKVLSGWSRPCSRANESELDLKKGKRLGDNRRRAKQQRRNSNEREDDFTFRHYYDTRRYIEEYRYYHARGDVGKEQKSVVFGVHVEDPYFPKLRTSVSQLFFDFSELTSWLPGYRRSRRIFERMNVVNSAQRLSSNVNHEDNSVVDRGESCVDDSTDDETIRLPNSPGDKKSPEINLAPVRADLNLPRILPCKTGQSDDEENSSNKSNRRRNKKSKDTAYYQNLPRLGSLPIPVCVTHRRSGKGKAARGRVSGQSDSTNSHSTGSGDAVSSVESYKSGNSSNNSAGQFSNVSIGNNWIPDGNPTMVHGNSALELNTASNNKDPETASTYSQRERASWEKRSSLEHRQRPVERSKTFTDASLYTKGTIKISYREEPSYKVWKDFTESTAYRDYLAKLYNLNSSRMKLKTAGEATDVKKQFRLCSENNKPKTRAERRVCCARCEEKKNSPDLQTKPRVRPRVQLVLQSGSKGDITSMPPLVRLNTMVRGYPYRTAEQHSQYMSQLTATQQKST
ncbi:uncharacterized protein [Branchiostoma lanceolatum]|uniref:uncharacterized protein isoform X1 n=1 Tax=Branchiostoma lanceolatum TaxID=7740 RepID=UPI003453F9B6